MGDPFPLPLGVINIHVLEWTTHYFHCFHVFQAYQGVPQKEIGLKNKISIILLSDGNKTYYSQIKNNIFFTIVSK